MAGKISLALSAVLAAAVIYLFTQKPSTSSEEPANQASLVQANSSENGISLNVAYIDEDSLFAKYEYVLVEQPKLIERLTRKQATLEQEARKYEEEAMKFQNYLQTGNPSEAEYNAGMMDLQRREQDLQRRQSDLQKTEQEFMLDVQQRVQSYLDDYCEENGVDLLLSHNSTLTVMLYREGMPNITDAVVEGLNDEYAAETGASDE